MFQGLAKKHKKSGSDCSPLEYSKEHSCHSKDIKTWETEREFPSFWFQAGQRGHGPDQKYRQEISDQSTRQVLGHRCVCIKYVQDSKICPSLKCWGNMTFWVDVCMAIINV